MLDVKCFDNEEHIKITGLNNLIVLKNLKYLLEKDKLYEVRTVVAPNLNNEYTIKEVTKIIDNKCKYKINNYRKYRIREKVLKLYIEVCTSEEKKISNKKKNKK